MMRRMKIKAAPNLFGGSKKGNILGKKNLPATPVTKDVSEIISVDNCSANSKVLPSVSHEKKKITEVIDLDPTHEVINLEPNVDSTKSDSANIEVSVVSLEGSSSNKDRRVSQEVVDIEPGGDNNQDISIISQKKNVTTQATRAQLKPSSNCEVVEIAQDKIRCTQALGNEGPNSEGTTVKSIKPTPQSKYINPLRLGNSHSIFDRKKSANYLTSRCSENKTNGEGTSFSCNANTVNISNPDMTSQDRSQASVINIESMSSPSLPVAHTPLLNKNSRNYLNGNSLKRIPSYQPDSLKTPDIIIDDHLDGNTLPKVSESYNSDNAIDQFSDHTQDSVIQEVDITESAVSKVADVNRFIGLKPTLSMNLGKIPGRRSRIKGCPVITRRPPKPAARGQIGNDNRNNENEEHAARDQIGNENRNNGNEDNVSEITVIENETENSQLSIDCQNNTDALEDTSSSIICWTGITTGNIESKENINRVYKKDLPVSRKQSKLSENSNSATWKNTETNDLNANDISTTETPQLKEFGTVKANLNDSSIRKIFSERTDIGRTSSNIDNDGIKCVRPSKTRAKLREHSKKKPKLEQVCVISPITKECGRSSPILKRKYNKLCMSAIKSEELPIEKKFFYEQKLNFRKKITSGNLEKSKLTMFDLIYWNPPSNPMPGRLSEGRSSSRRNSINDSDSITSEVIEEQNVEEEGLTKKTNETKPVLNAPSPQAPSSPVESEEEGESALAPQVKIGPNGELMVDEKSLIIQTTAAKNRDEILSRTEVVEESNESSHYGKWSKKRKRSTEWTRKETARFYKALSTVGTDFSLMETVFHWRSRSELKIKYKKEERINRHLIDTALNDCTQFDFSIFDESDYDPEEDRKTAKEAEKAEAKRKRDIEREQRKLQKEEEKRIRKEQEQIEKLRKKKLKNIYRKQKRTKASSERSVSTRQRKARSSNLEPQEVICEVLLSPKAKNKKTQDIEPLEDDPLSNPSVESGSDISKDLAKNLFPDHSPEKSVEDDHTTDHSPAPEIVDVGCDDKIILSPILSAEQFSISSSSFTVKDSSQHAVETIPATEIGFCDETFVEDGVKGPDGASIAVSSIPVAIDTQLYSRIYENTKSEDTELDSQNELEEGGGTEKQVVTTEQQSIPQDLDNDVWQVCLPVSCVQKCPDGTQFVEVTTVHGPKRIVVPLFDSHTASIVIVAESDRTNPPERLYHVYTVAPLNPDSEVNPDSEINPDSEVNFDGDVNPDCEVGPPSQPECEEEKGS